jgi:hypothetical protein
MNGECLIERYVIICGLNFLKFQMDQGNCLFLWSILGWAWETFSSEELVAGLLVIPLHFVGKGLSLMGFFIEKNIGDAATHLVRIYKDSPLHL